MPEAPFKNSESVKKSVAADSNIVHAAAKVESVGCDASPLCGSLCCIPTWLCQRGGCGCVEKLQPGPALLHEGRCVLHVYHGHPPDQKFEEMYAIPPKQVSVRKLRDQRLSEKS